MSDQQAPPAQLVIDVTIKDGEVTPTNAQFNAKVNEPIVLRVNSDAADQLHVHSTPEHTFDVEPKHGQSFQFTVAVPGKVDIELHQLDTHHRDHHGAVTAVGRRRSWPTVLAVPPIFRSPTPTR